MTEEIQRAQFGDVNTSIEFTIVDQDGDIVPLAGFTTLTITAKKPDGTTVDWAASLLTDGSDGIMHYLTLVGDLDQSGEWELQGFVVIGANQHHTNQPHILSVGENL